MAYEKRDMSGSLFKNDKREKDTHPNATGTAIIDGVEYWVSAWTKQGQKGPFQSLAFKRKEERKQEIRQQTSTYDEPDDDLGGGGGFSRDLDDDIPF